MRGEFQLRDSGHDAQPRAVSREVQKGIEDCMACHKACEQLIIHCLLKGGAHADVAHIRTLMDCSQICRVAADFMLRDSNLHSQICEVCATACALCAQDCRSMEGDPVMQECANLCEQCALTCRSLSERH